MALLTPPLTFRRPGLIAPRTKPQYYEDIYGHRNYDEEFDRFPDECEETDSDDGEAATVSTAATGLLRGRALKLSQRSKEDRIPKAPLRKDSVKQSRSTSSNPTWQINPKINKKTSIPVLRNRQFTSRKFGMFGGAQPELEPLDTNAFALSDLGDLNDDYQLLGHSSDGYSQLGQESNDEDATSGSITGNNSKPLTTPMTNSNSEQAEPVLAETTQPTEEDGRLGISIDDNAQARVEKAIMSHIATRGRPPKVTPSKASHATGNTSTGHYETRASSTRALRSAAKGKASARAATLHKKTKRKKVAAKGEARIEGRKRRSARVNEREGRPVMVKGPKKLYVVIPKNEVDMAEFEKHF